MSNESDPLQLSVNNIYNVHRFERLAARHEANDPTMKLSNLNYISRITILSFVFQSSWFSLSCLEGHIDIQFANSGNLKNKKMYVMLLRCSR